MALETPEILTAPKNKKIQYIIGAVFVLAAIIPSVYFYTQYRQAQDRLANPNLFAQEEAKKYVAQISKLMMLPEDETPTVATDNDKEKLKNQPFFANAENGDKVLIYTNAKKAILFRPSANRIIDVAPVNIGPPATESATTTKAVVKQTVTFVLRNGTDVVGLTKKYETELKSKIPDAEVLDRDNASTNAYAKTVLVDTTGKKSAQASQLAGALGITVSSMPTGESTPSADFLIILGADKK